MTEPFLDRRGLFSWSLPRGPAAGVGASGTRPFAICYNGPDSAAPPDEGNSWRSIQSCHDQV